jgi:hypothetical protein
VFACNVINHIANKEAILKNIAPNLLKRKREEIPTMCETKKIVEELRNKKSRDNRELLDRSADMIEKLAKELCEKSGCHHRCHDTKDCVVEDEALLLINENKSNNFDIKSNEELFKQALVEGVNRHIDKTIEEEKQIEEMADIITDIDNNGYSYDEFGYEIIGYANSNKIAAVLYNAGYRKQSEWISVEDRLPEVYDPCLVAIRVDEGVKIDLGERIKCYNACKMEHYEEWCLTTTDYGEITHWMPLPEAPKMKGGEE